MVWNNLGSPLYNAVERHNSSAHSPVSEAKEEKLPPPLEHSEKPYISGTPQPFSQLFRDRDTLLLAAVLLILLHEKADMKLILALAFVIFS